MESEPIIDLSVLHTSMEDKLRKKTDDRQLSEIAEHILAFFSFSILAQLNSRKKN